VQQGKTRDKTTTQNPSNVGKKPPDFISLTFDLGKLERTFLAGKLFPLNLSLSRESCAKR
jgi:hypothetical protein